MGVMVHPGRLRQEMIRRGWAACDLARQARVSEATVSAALAGRPIAPSTLGRMAGALAKAPVLQVIDSLIFGDDRAVG
jgi:transcriptional regulator with XRE-family HTH domain